MQKPDAEVERIAAVLHDQYKLERVAPGHCTGEPEFAALRRAFGDHYLYAGVGTVIELPGQKTVPSASSHIVADTSDDSKSYPSDPEKMDVSKTMLHIRGFADFGLGGSTQKEGSAAFSMGELNLFITISDRLKFLSEIVFENEDEGQYSSQYSGQSNDFTVDVERALLEYSYNDYLNLAIGR